MICPTEAESVRPAEQANQEHIHHSTADERSALLDVLDQLRIPDHEKTRIRHCGSDAWLQRSPSTGRWRIAANTCRSRLCPRCKQTSSALTRERLTKAMTDATGRQWRLITLTLRSCSSDLPGQLDNLTKAFRRLRHCAWWKRRIDGGYAAIELTRNEETGLWHPHVHVIAAGQYLNKFELSDQWRRASKGSYIVDVKLVRQPDQAARYIAKYLGKPTLAVLRAPAHVLNEFIELTKKHRLFIRFGNVAPLPPKDEIWENPNDWQPYQPLHVVLHAANNGDYWARAILTALENHDDGSDQIDYSDP